MKWYKTIAPVSRVQIIPLFFTKRTHGFLKCAQRWISRWEKQVNSGTSCFWKELRRSTEASPAGSLTEVPSAEYNTSLRVSLPLHVYMSLILSGWLSRRSAVLLGRRKEKTDIGQATYNACNRCHGWSTEGPEPTHWPAACPQRHTHLRGRQHSLHLQVKRWWKWFGPPSKGTVPRRRNRSSISYLLVLTNYPKPQWPEARNIYYLRVSAGQESGVTLTQTLSVTRLPPWCWAGHNHLEAQQEQICFQAHSHGCWQASGACWLMARDIGPLNSRPYNRAAHNMAVGFSQSKWAKGWERVPKTGAEPFCN